MKQNTLSKSAARRKAYDDSQIARAVSFTAFIQLSPSVKHSKSCHTKEDAIAAAKEFNRLSEYGRQALVYAVTPEGYTIPVDYV